MQHKNLSLLFAFLFLAFVALSLTGCPPNQPPLAEFDVWPSGGEAPLTVDFTDLSIPGGKDISDWAWDFGDGSSSQLRNPSHVYTAKGLYDVSLTVKTRNGSSTRLKEGLIQVGMNFQCYLINTGAYPIKELFISEADASSIGRNQLAAPVAADETILLSKTFQKSQQIVMVVFDLGEGEEVYASIRGNMQTRGMPDDFVSIWAGCAVDGTASAEYSWGAPETL